MADLVDRSSVREQQLVDDALALMRLAHERPAGNGYCEGCGHEIPQERLTRVPTARLCVPCGTLAERQRGIRR